MSEIFGAAGLVLPMATGGMPWLTPLAAIGLALIVLLASGFHLRGDERLEALETALWACIAAVIAIGRWDLLATRLHTHSSVIVTLLAVLVPSAIINVIVLIRRPARSSSSQSYHRAAPRIS